MMRHTTRRPVPAHTRRPGAHAATVASLEQIRAEVQRRAWAYADLVDELMAEGQTLEQAMWWAEMACVADDHDWRKHYECSR